MYGIKFKEIDMSKELCLKLVFWLASRRDDADDAHGRLRSSILDIENFASGSVVLLLRTKHASFPAGSRKQLCFKANSHKRYDHRLNTA